MDFAAAKTFLQNQGYEITEFTSNYDHGSYYVVATIKAKKQDEGLDDHISLECNEYDSYRDIKLYHKLSTTHLTSSIGVDDVTDWLSDGWTTAIEHNSREDVNAAIAHALGKNFYFFGDIDTVAKKIDYNTLFDYYRKNKPSEVKDGWSIYLLNSNPAFGDLRYYWLTYRRVFIW